MGRTGYLWGTRETQYCELGRSENLEGFLRGLGAVSPDLALEETRNMLSGCELPKEGTARGAGEFLTVRYSPVHLYKKQESLKDMQGFYAFCVNGPEECGQERESYKSHLTMFDREDLKGGTEKKQAYPDRIFGTLLMTPEAEKRIRDGAKAVNFAPEPGSADTEIPEEEVSVAALIVTALYQDVDTRVVIRMPETEDFLKKSLAVLAGAYSLLPEKMAAETGFSIGEQPSKIREQCEKANTRIFVLSSDADADPGTDFPEKTVFLDLSRKEALPQNYDTELDGLIRRWAALPFEKRHSAMAVYLADETEYFRREYYAEGSRKFFENTFWDWKNRENLRFDPGEAKGVEAQYLEVKELYKAFAQFDICRKVPWVREEFVKMLPEFLMEGDSIETLRQAVVRKAVAAGEKNPNTVENCRGYRKWLTGLLSPEKAGEDDAFDCARLTAEDAAEQAARAANTELEEKIREKEDLIREREQGIRERDLQLLQQAEQYRALQAEIEDKETQWGAFVDSLEQQLGSGAVRMADTQAARQLNPMAAEQVDALQLDLEESRSDMEELREELRQAKGQLEHEKRADARHRQQQEELIRKLKLAMIGVLIAGILLGAVIGRLIP